MAISSRHIFFCALIALFIVLAGCGGFEKGSTMKTVDFRKGTQGITMSFMDNAPPATMFVGNEFSVAVKLKNTGAFNIETDAGVTLEVPDEQSFYFPDGKMKAFQLAGKSLYVGDGEETVLFFPAKALCFPGYDGTRASVQKNYTGKLKAMACYIYETDANADVCVDTRAFSRQSGEKSSCPMQAVSLSGGQGGPVEVTQLSPQIIPMTENKVKFQLGITVKKVDDDTIRLFSPESAGCGDYERANIVPISVEMGGKPMECDMSELKLQKGGVSLMCSRSDLTLDSGAFKSPVSVKLRYMVQQGILKDINVQAPPSSSEIDCGSLKGDSSSAGSSD